MKLGRWATFWNCMWNITSTQMSGTHNYWQLLVHRRFEYWIHETLFFFSGRGGGCITYTRFTAGRLFPGFFGVAVCTVAQYLLLQSFHSVFNYMFLLYSEKLSQRLHDFISLKCFYWQIHKSGVVGQQLQLHPKEVDPAAFAVLGTAGTVWAWPL